MIEYPKIQSIFKRDEKTHRFIEGAWSLSEFEYLKDNEWVFTEKVDGTNLRVEWDMEKITFAGRTDNAQMYAPLIQKLQELFTIEKFKSFYPDISICLYGEGYGAKVQKGGGNYLANGVDFVLFDVLIDRWWLERDNINDIATKLNIDVVPIVGEGTLDNGIALIKSELQSTWGDFRAEGIVCKPKIELFNRMGNRIITKLKHRDFGI
jgi:ATP-dependent RNA circularization protein (DNA/RNA ligase family)